MSRARLTRLHVFCRFSLVAPSLAGPHFAAICRRAHLAHASLQSGPPLWRPQVLNLTCCHTLRRQLHGYQNLLEASGDCNRVTLRLGRVRVAGGVNVVHLSTSARFPKTASGEVCRIKLLTLEEDLRLIDEVWILTNMSTGQGASRATHKGASSASPPVCCNKWHSERSILLYYCISPQSRRLRTFFPSA